MLLYQGVGSGRTELKDQSRQELMMILMFLTGAAVLGDVLHGLHMPRRSYV